MLPFMFAAYIGTRRPMILPGREPVPVVHCDTDPACAVTRRLAREIELASPGAARRNGPATAGLGVIAELAFPRGEPETRTALAGWSAFACALFAETR